MAVTQYYAAASLDGYIARPDGSIDWLQRYGEGADLGAGPMSDGSYEEFYAGIGALVMGSKTYEYILEHASKWPYDRPSWIFTTRDLPKLPGADVRFVQGGPEAVHREASTAAGDKNVWMVGGGDIASQWAESGLIDELLITLVPVVLAEGLPLFAEPVAGELRLNAAKPFPNGMLELTYELPRRS